MDKDLKKHVRLVEEAIRKNAGGFKWDALRQENRTRIGFFQHERLIHLLITLFFGLVFFMDALAVLLTNNPALMILAVILLIMTVLYVWHYYRLENGVQKLYRLDDEIGKRIKKVIR